MRLAVLVVLTRDYHYGIHLMIPFAPTAAVR